MTYDALIERFFEALVSGDRDAARSIVREASPTMPETTDLIVELFWPTYEMIEKLSRNDQLSALSYRMSIRLLRVLVDQASATIARAPSRNKRVFAVGGPTDSDDLGVQMAVDMLEANGFTVAFAGGGIPADEILDHVHTQRPDALLMFCPSPQDLPAVRQVIDTIHEINAVPDLQIVVGGGVFNRADGLAEEIGADLWAADPLDLVDELVNHPDRKAEPEQRTVGRRRKTRTAA